MFCLSNILDQEKRSKYEEFVHNHENKEYVYIGKNQYGNLLFFLNSQSKPMLWGEGVVVVCTRRIGSLCGSKVAASHSNDNKSWLEEIWATAEKQQCQFWKATGKVLTTRLVEIKTTVEIFRKKDGHKPENYSNGKHGENSNKMYTNITEMGGKVQHAGKTKRP